ncbi:hypothetical protein C8N35_10236 [Breoghania corrubedonensis]|uniref:Uncharacterized protein n=1 Tax=Breoghania corrubedonensis TaxID=665038 RepID=A0A2T5VC54_9HYPH|nr:hypothetical protein [Breoghania corrubedonensis]PTW61327.1 hypothetical protein C8N35_10236 [Breoghania corrubedonensis]
MTIETFRDANDAPPPPGGLEFFETKDLISPFGYKAVEIDGTWFWMPGTEEDYRKAESERLRLEPSDVEIRLSCYQTGPKTCGGMCGTGFCRLMFNPAQNFYYCACG